MLKRKRQYKRKHVSKTKSSGILKDIFKRKRTIFWMVITALLMVGWLVVQYETYTDPSEADVIVYKSASCSCYRSWVRQLQKNGLAVSVVQKQDLIDMKTQLGVPREFAACHTAAAGKYWIEGHVPADSIKYLINEQPKEVGGLAHLRVPLQNSTNIEYEVVTYDAKGKAKTELATVHEEGLSTLHNEVETH
jgi:hypothetical protein